MKQIPRSEEEEEGKRCHDLQDRWDDSTIAGRGR
jgi:hypothetical protein